MVTGLTTVMGPVVGVSCPARENTAKMAQGLLADLGREQPIRERVSIGEQAVFYREEASCSADSQRGAGSLLSCQLPVSTHRVPSSDPIPAVCPGVSYECLSSF